MKDKTLRIVTAFFLIIAAVMVLIAVQAVKNINRTTRDNDWVNHTHAVITQIDGLSTTLYVTNATTRAYVATGDPGDLASSNRALSSITEYIKLLKALTRQEPAQAAQVLQIEEFAAAHAKTIQDILALKQSGQSEEARNRLTATLSGQTVPELELAIKGLRDEELDLLSERDTAVYLQAESMRWTVWSAVVIDILLLGGAAWLIRDDLRARRRAAEALATANAHLEQRVQERTRELASANEELTRENLERAWANQALEHQLRYNHSIVDSITDLIFVLTKSGNISRVNPAVHHNTRWNGPDLIHQAFSKVLRLTYSDRAEHEDLQHKVVRLMKEGRDLRDKTAVIIGRDQQETPVRFSLFPLRDEDKVIGAVAILQIIPPKAEPKDE